ncbi:hypothetical protein KQI89_16960 [Clostridium sp. MSJ-4]|uniref:Uncharacterized protein n=1 Tax=Clostridium simiarum TaxID=2841506 RepID=A0ABS6F589_9CLOT|nr:hypothetical protein [Clostridium simiarum]MBU5593433.1 hypothetical protein [Clostridium simiarum]
MKSKFITSMICVVTAVSLVSIPKVQAKAIDCNNSEQIQYSITSSENVQQSKIHIEEIEESSANAEIKNAPRSVRGILSAPMSRNFDNIIEFFEDNKDIFRISDPKNQLELLRDSNDVFRLSQVVNGITTDNTYIVVFNDNNQIKSVHGYFDNSLYQADSEANVEPTITERQALQIAKADVISSILRSDKVPKEEKGYMISRINDIALSHANITLYICKYTGYDEELQGKYLKTYKVENLGLADLYISVTSGEIVRRAPKIIFN